MGIKTFDDPISMLRDVLGDGRKPPETLAECRLALEQVGALLAEIYEMGGQTVKDQPHGYRWPWCWYAEKALKILGKYSTDYEVQTSCFRSFWETDAEIAQRARTIDGITGKPKENAPDSSEAEPTAGAL